MRQSVSMACEESLGIITLSVYLTLVTRGYTYMCKTPLAEER